MCSMKRVRLAVLFLVAAALLAGTPEFAAAGNFNVKLTPTGIEPGASGQARLSVHYPGIYPGPNVEGQLSLSCRGLTPGATYYFWAMVYVYPYGFGGLCTWPFTASAKGVGQAEAWIYVGLFPFPVGVTNANGDDVLIGEVL